MPYIITTTDPVDRDQSKTMAGGVLRYSADMSPVFPGPTGVRPSKASRTAVAALDEAQNAAHAAVHAAYRAAYPIQPRGLGGEHSDAQRAHRWHNVDVERLPESGGTVGPLPDGTVIEVRQVDWSKLASQSLSNDRFRYVTNPAYGVERYSDEILAAFNEV